MASLGLGYYGSWLTVVDTITTDQQNLNLWTYISTRAASRFNWNRNGGKKLRGIITINSGVNIYSNNPLTPAITIPADSASTFRSYDQVIIINKGSILGAAGVGAIGGGSTSGFDGGKGGTAIYTRRNLIITNNGNIYGGGGGGGGGGGAFKTEVTSTPTNCPGASYCDQCCILNCQGRNYCSTPNDCTLGAACYSSCQYYTNANPNCNGSTVGTCVTKYRACTTYTGGKGGNGQGYGSVPTSGTTGIIYGASIFTGSGGDGGAWGQDGEDGLAGSNTSFGNGGQGGCWIDGSEFTTIQTNNDERGYQCTSSGSGTLPVLWSGWSSQPSITTTPPDGSGVTISTQSTDLYIEPRQALTTIIVNSPNNLGGAIDLSNSRLLQTMTCNTQSIASLNLTNCSNLKTLNFNSNNLSTLNVSHCVSLETLNLENNNIGGNLSGLSNISLTQNTTRTISIKNNNMSATNLNDIFNQLPQKPPSITPEWSIYIDNNTGTCSCNWLTAKNKDWRVYPTLYSLTSNVDTTDEGTTVNFILDSTLLGDGTVPYTITGITPADINGASLTGNFTLYKGSGMVSFTITNDVLLEGTETMTLTINSATCPTSKSITINDTSKPPVEVGLAFVTLYNFSEFDSARVDMNGGGAGFGGWAQIVFRHPNHPTVADSVYTVNSETNGTQGDDAIVRWFRSTNTIVGYTSFDRPRWSVAIPWLDVTGVKFYVNAGGGFGSSASGMQYQ